jgi:hypothetical protein
MEVCVIDYSGRFQVGTVRRSMYARMALRQIEWVGVDC